MIKKIGILTFQDSINYGAILQAYALQTYLSDLSKENHVSIINYVNPKRKYSQIKGIRKVVSLIWNNSFGLLFRDAKRLKRTKAFKRKFFRLTQNFKSRSQLLNASSVFDYYIVGSDQVWNPRNTNSDLSYFFDFVEDDKTKISYAPSFGGTSVNDAFISGTKILLERFKKISIRENAGLTILRDKYSLDAKVVCDPVFLLKREKWIDIIDERLIKEKYILCYYMPGDKKGEDMILSISVEITAMRSCGILPYPMKQ